MLGELLPPQVAAAEVFGDADGDILFPEERSVVARAVEKRRREFTTGRACARKALAALGLPAVPIAAGPRGAPQWPRGIVGSITHCAGYRASAAARSTQILTVGVDAEPDGALPGGVLGMVTSPAERAHLATLPAGGGGPAWDRLLFSAKESVYKAWYPLAGRWLGFEDALVTIDPSQRTFTARLLVPGPAIDGTPVTGFTGRWLARDGLIITAIAVPRPPAGTGPVQAPGAPARPFR